MMVSLSYNFSLFVSEDYSHVDIFGDRSTFKFTKKMYVFTIIFIFYLVYSHDFSYVSSGIQFREHTKDGQLIKTLLRLKYFPNSEL
jgi:hypothetical protein